MELRLIYGVLHPNYEESGSLELNLDFSPADIATSMKWGQGYAEILALLENSQWSYFIDSL